MSQADKELIIKHIDSLEANFSQQQIISGILAEFLPESEPEPEPKKITKLEPEIKKLDPDGLFHN